MPRRLGSKRDTETNSKMLGLRIPESLFRRAQAVADILSEQNPGIRITAASVIRSACLAGMGLVERANKRKDGHLQES